MRCDECLAMLDPYVEDEFDEQTAKSLAVHLAACGQCAGAHEALRREQEIYASYLLDAEPTQDLWTNLRSELEKQKVHRGWQPLRLQRWVANAFGGLHFTPHLAAALVLIIIGLVLGIMVWRRTIVPSSHDVQNPRVAGVQPSSQVNGAAVSRDSNNTDRRNSANANDGKIQSSSPKSRDIRHEIKVSGASRGDRHIIERSPAAAPVDLAVLRAEQQYLSAIEILSRDIKRHRDVISPALLSQLETALAEVDRNIAATRKVAREQPRDPVVVQYLALAYEKKVELLREVTSW